jgi:hypothetical protein
MIDENRFAWKSLKRIKKIKQIWIFARNQGINYGLFGVVIHLRFGVHRCF